jgi:hypothetical protein
MGPSGKHAAPGAARKEIPNIWALAGVVYGIVAATTILALGVYFYLASGAKRDNSGQLDNVLVGSVWVPSYPDAVVREVNSSKQGDSTEGTLRFKTADSVQSVLSFYRTRMNKGSYHVYGNSGGDTVRAISASGRIAVQVSRDASGKETEGIITTHAQQIPKK